MVGFHDVVKNYTFWVNFTPIIIFTPTVLEICFYIIFYIFTMMIERRSTLIFVSILRFVSFKFKFKCNSKSLNEGTKQFLACVIQTKCFQQKRENKENGIFYSKNNDQIFWSKEKICFKYILLFFFKTLPNNGILEVY